MDTTARRKGMIGRRPLILVAAFLVAAGVIAGSCPQAGASQQPCVQWERYCPPTGESCKSDEPCPCKVDCENRCAQWSTEQILKPVDDEGPPIYDPILPGNGAFVDASVEPPKMKIPPLGPRQAASPVRPPPTGVMEVANVSIFWLVTSNVWISCRSGPVP